MFANSAMVGRSGEPCSWKRRLPRHRDPVSRVRRVFAAHRKADWPNSFFELVAWFLYQSWVAREAGFSIASSNEIPADAGESLWLVSQYAGYSSIWVKSDAVRPKTDGRNLTIVVGNHKTSA